MALFSKKETTKKKVAKKSTTKQKAVSVRDADGLARLSKHPSSIVYAPIISEKALTMTAHDVYTLEVARDATKRDIITAVQALFGVTPRKVNIVRKAPRVVFSRRRGRAGKQSGMKKAYIFLAKGEKIDIA
jgi:large subunit ribosomal protein L23